MESSPRACNLSELVEQHYQLLYRYAYRLSGSAADAEDLTQQAFLNAQANLHQLRDPCRARGWLCTIVRNEFLKSCTPRGRAAVVSLEHVGEPRDEPIADTSVDEEELQRALNELPEEFRSPLILFYFEEFSYKDIAEQMDVPIGTVMSRLARAKSHLRRRLASGQPTANEQTDSPAIRTRT